MSLYLYFNLNHKQIIMFKRIFLLAIIYSLLCIACNKEEALPPIIEKAYNYENQLKLNQFNLNKANVECVGDYDDLFDGEYYSGPQPVNQPICFTPEPKDLFYILIDLQGANLTLNLHLYEDLANAIDNDDVELIDIKFSYTPDVNNVLWAMSEGESLNLNIGIEQKYTISFNISFTDEVCIYEKSALFIISREGDLKIQPIDNTSFVDNPKNYGCLDSGAAAVAIIVP